MWGKMESDKNKLIRDALGMLAVLKRTVDKVELAKPYSYEEKAIKVRIIEIRDILIRALNSGELGPGDKKSKQQ